MSAGGTSLLKRFAYLFYGLAFTFLLTGMATPPAGEDQTTLNGLPIHDFNLPSLDGTMVHLSDLRGTYPVMLIFYTTWCPPCNSEVPRLNQIHDKYAPRGLKVLAVDIQEGEAWVRQWADRRGARYPILLDQRGSVAADYGIGTIPTNILLRFDGEVTFWHNVTPSDRQVEALFAEAKA